MDQAAKTYLEILTIFLGAILLLGIVSFYFVSASARNSAYSIVEYIEINGYDEKSAQNIKSFADQKNLDVTVSRIDEGIHADGDRNRFRVDVSFEHLFAIPKRNKLTTYTLYTRAVDY